MNKFFKTVGIIFLLIIVIYGYKAFRLFSVRKHFKEYGEMKVDSQAFRPQAKILPEPIMDFFPSRRPDPRVFVDNYYRHAGNATDDDFNKGLDEIFKDYIPSNINDFAAKLAPKFLPKIGYLKVSAPCSFEEAENLPPMPDLEKMEEIMFFWCYLSRYFAQKNDEDTSMLLAYAPITYAKDLETKYADCASVEAKRVSDSIVRAACMTIIYMSEKTNPNSRYIRLIVNDLYTLLENEFPLSRCVKYKKYIITSVVEAKRKKGSKFAGMIQENSVMQGEINSFFDELLKYVDEPLEKVDSEFKNWQKKKKKFFYDPLAELSIFDYERNIPAMMLANRFYNYYQLREDQEKHIKMLKSCIKRLALYSYKTSRGHEPDSDEELEKWLGRKLP